MQLLTCVFLYSSSHCRALHPFPTRRSSDLRPFNSTPPGEPFGSVAQAEDFNRTTLRSFCQSGQARSEEHTSELQSHVNLVCRLLLEKKNHILKVFSHLKIHREPNIT